MNKLINYGINYLWIYLIYLSYTFLFLAIDIFTIDKLSEKFLLPLIISLVLYLVIIGMITLYQQVKNKRYFILASSLIFIVVLVAFIISAIKYANIQDEAFLIILVFSLIPIIFYLIPYLGKILFKSTFSKIQFYLVIYILIPYLIMYIIHGLFIVNGRMDYYILIFSITFPFIYALFSRLTYSENVINHIKDVFKLISNKQFIHCIITLILLIVFIYGVYTVSNASQNVREWVFKEYSVIDAEYLKSLILEERIKGGILAAFGGVGLLVKYIFATSKFYKR